MLILLSPSKTQKVGHGFEEMDHTIPAFQEEANGLVSSLSSLSIDELATLMKISTKLATTTQQRFTAFSPKPNPNNGTQALLSFRGDVYSEIHADGYSTDDFTFAQKHLRILSGLYGLLRPLDLMQPYRLEMGGGFVPEGAKNLYDFWGKKITTELQQIIDTDGHGELLNLASQEYFKAIDIARLSVPVTQVIFKQEKEGKLRTIAIHAKKARGALTDYIIRHQINTSPALTDFTYGGYHYAGSQSSKNELYFIRKE